MPAPMRLTFPRSSRERQVTPSFAERLLDGAVVRRRGEDDLRLARLHDRVDVHASFGKRTEEIGCRDVLHPVQRLLERA